MDGLVQELKRQVFKTHQDMVPSWYEVVNWKEPFIVGLLSFHILMLVLVITTRTKLYPQFFLFLTICGLVRISEYLNNIGHVHWESFATQQYFDSSGFFMILFFSGPLLTIGFIQLVSNLYVLGSMVIRVKRMEIKNHCKKEKKNSHHSNKEIKKGSKKEE